MPIKFGTDGWRDIIAEDYTFENVAKVSYATAAYFKKLPMISEGIFIGYDARFGSRDFAILTARIMASQGIKTYLATSIVATPATSLAIVRKKLAGGVMITASHNPAKYNGYKIKGYYGGAALPEAIEAIEEHCKFILTGKVSIEQSFSSLPSYEELVKKKKIIPYDARKSYIKRLGEIVDLALIKKSKLRIAYDPMYGSGIETLEHLLPDAGILHNVWNPGFGGTPPEPLAKNTNEISDFVVERGYDLGIVTDGDADRIGMIDKEGNFFSSQMILCLLLKYLVEVKKKRGNVVVSLSVTSMIDKMCEKYKLLLQRTPVGFKYITKFMIDGGVLIGGEESGGIGIPSLHIPERDGLFNGLLIAELCAHYKKPLSRLVEDLEKEYGPHKYNRFDLHTTEIHIKQVLEKAKKGFEKIAGLKVLKTITTDGFKYLLDGGGWMMIRTSGTEPLLRYYAEAPSEDTVKKILAFAKKL
jgi:phosphomannomutase